MSSRWLPLASRYSSRKERPRRFLAQPAVERLEDRTLLAAPSLASFAQVPLAFEPNVGQTDSQVNFVSRGDGYALFLTPAEAVLNLQHGQGAPGQGPSDVLRLQLVGANPAAPASGQERLPGVSNYLIGPDPSRWHTGVANYARVQYQGVYPGIDLVYYGNQRQLEYDFVLAPHADPGAIRLSFSGTTSVAIDAQGNLVLHTAGGDVVEHAPVIYQGQGTERWAVSGHYVPLGDRQVGFSIGSYDTKQPLTIDPTLAYSTILGGAGDDEGASLTVDGTGSVSVVGCTQSSNFPTLNPLQGASAGGSTNQDALVVKLNADGALAYSTYIGGDGDDKITGVARDAAGNLWLVGHTDSTGVRMPTTTAANGPGGSEDLWVGRLKADGSSLLFGQYIGGTGDDFSAGLALDPSGNVYLTGFTSSTDFPVSAGAYQPTFGGSIDAFAAKLSNTGGSYLYGTYLGGGGFDSASGIAVDAAGSAYIGGATTSSDLKTTLGAYQTTFGGVQDGFLVKLDIAGSTALFSTLLGGTESDSVNAVAVNGTIPYVVGSTDSSNFKTTASAFQKTFGGTTDAFVVQLDPAGATAAYSTFFGGSDEDQGNSLAVDTAGNTTITGTTASTDLPLKRAFEPTFHPGGTHDVFVARLNTGGATLNYSTYLGGGGEDHADDIALDSSGAAYVIGQTSSTDFPTAPPAPTANNGGTDVFVAKIDLADAHFKVDVPATVTAGQSFTVTVTALNPNNSTATDYTGVVHFTSSDVLAQAGIDLPVDTSFLATDLGAHSFTVTLKTAGAQTITVTDTQVAAITGQGKPTVNAAPASSLVLSLFPATTTAGEAHDVKVTARDPFGNIATGYSRQVTLTSSDGKAVLPVPYTFVANDKGVHTFTSGVSLKTAGTQSLTVTSNDLPPLMVKLNGIVVNPAATAKFTFSGLPTSVPSGTAADFTLTAQDGFGNVTPGYRGTVNFSSSDQAANFTPALYAFQAGDNGVHAFASGVVLRVGGAQTLTAKDSTNDAVQGTSASIQVLAVVNPAEELFVIGTDSQAYVQKLDVNGLPMGGYLALQANFTVKALAEATLPSGTPLLFAIGGDDKVYRMTFDATGAATSTFTLVSGLATKALRVTSDARGRPHLFAQMLDANGATVYHQRFDAAGSPTGSFELTQNSPVKGLAVGRDGTGRQELFVIAANDNVYAMTFDENGNRTSPYLAAPASGGVVKALAVGNAGGRLELFVIQRDNSFVYTALFDASGNAVGGYAPAQDGAMAQSLAVGQTPDNRPELFVVGGDNRVYYKQYDTSGARIGSYLGTGSSATSDLAVSRDSTLRMQLFAWSRDSGAVTTQYYDATGVPAGSFLTVQTTAVTGLTLAPVPFLAGAATSIRVLGPAAGATAGQPVTVTLTALDANANIAPGYRGTVHVTSGDGQAVLPVDAPFAAMDQGVHDVSLTLKTAGSQQVSVQDTIAATIEGLGLVSVAPAAASVVTVSGLPSPTPASVSQNATVTLKDPFGNIATGYTGTIKLTSSDPQAVLPSSYPFTSADAGVHALPVTFKTAGQQSVTATDTAQSALTGMQSGVLVVLTAAQLALSDFPTLASAGSANSLTIRARDGSGNLVPGYRGTVHFTSTDGSAQLPADYQFTAADNGMHTFTGVVLRSPGARTVTVTDTVTTGLTGMLSALVVDGTTSFTFSATTGSISYTDAQWTFVQRQVRAPAFVTTGTGDAGGMATLVLDAGLNGPNPSATDTTASSRITATRAIHVGAGGATLHLNQIFTAQLMGASAQLLVSVRLANGNVAPLNPTSYVSGLKFVKVFHSRSAADLALAAGDYTLDVTYLLEKNRLGLWNASDTFAGAYADAAAGNLATIGFSAQNYTVLEQNGSVTLTGAVVRSGNTAGTSTVTLATVDASALASTNYNAISQTITFGPGETSKNVTITLQSDGVLKGNTAFDLVLSSPGAGAQVANNLAAVLIREANGTANQRLVNFYYQEVFHRNADAGGLTTFTNALNSGSMPPATVALTLLNSTEGRATFVTDLYDTVLRRSPENATVVQNFVNQLAAGLTRQQLEAQLYGSAEFRNNFASVNGVVNTQLYVTLLFQQILGRNPGTTIGQFEGKGFVDAINLYFSSGGKSGSSPQAVALQFLTSDEYYSSRLLPLWYARYMNRAADPGGLANFLNSLKAGVREETLISQYLGSPEYMSFI